jgi:hypothetical protein
MSSKNNQTTSIKYVLAGVPYRTKADVTQRCRDILNATPNNSAVTSDDFAFLMDLFSHHTEWDMKRGPGIAAIIPGDVAYGCRGFWLHRVDGEVIDISLHHAIKHLPTQRRKALMPQPLIDFKKGARQAIREQVEAFRKSQEAISGDQPSHVDHVYPRTFDALLFGFCLETKINPLQVVVDEQSAGIHYIRDDAIRNDWQAYHLHYAILSLVAMIDNLKAPKSKIDWAETWENHHGQPSSDSVDAYTRTCPVCGRAFQTDNYDDPDGGSVWMQWEGPCCTDVLTDQAA